MAENESLHSLRNCSTTLGGVNSFLKSFKEYLISKKQYSQDPFQSDIILYAASSAGVNKPIRLDEIKRFTNSRYRLPFNLLKKKKYPILVHRLDGLRAFYAGEKIPSDDLQFQLSNYADHIIFQSKYSLQNFQDFGYKKNNYTIINNGTNSDVFRFKKRKISNGNKLKIVACSWSDNINKGHEIISKFSEIDNVEITFVGNWNQTVPLKNVILIKPLENTELAKALNEHDVFLHAAKNDPCPNVVIEALASGLPIIFNTTGGTPEIAASYGEPLNEKDFSHSVSNICASYSSIVNKLEMDNHKFSINFIADEYIKTFQKLLNNDKFI